MYARLMASSLVAIVAASPAFADFWSDAGAKYEGVTIRGVSESTPPSNYVRDVLAPAFTEATGITIEFETTSWDQMYDKAIKDMEAGSGIYDFVYIEQDAIYSYLSRDFLVDLTTLLEENPDLQSDTFNIDDFTTFIDYFKGPDDGHLFGVPMEAFIKIFLYRKDLFEDPEIQAAFKEKYGYDLVPAESFQAWRDSAEFFTEYGKENDLQLWGTTVQAASGHPASWYEYFEVGRPALRRLRLGHQRRRELCGDRRERRLDELARGSRGAAVLPRQSRFRAARGDRLDLGRGRLDLRRRPRRAGPRLRRERDLDRDQPRQVRRRRQGRGRAAADRGGRDGGSRGRRRLHRLLRRRRLRHPAFVEQQGSGAAVPRSTSPSPTFRPTGRSPAAGSC